MFAKLCSTPVSRHDSFTTHWVPNVSGTIHGRHTAGAALSRPYVPDTLFLFLSPSAE